jgi:hypothetical protein
MKFLITVVLSLCIVFPVFSQSSGAQRYSALGDSIGITLTRSNSKLANYNSMIQDDGNNKVYTSYKRKFEVLVSALNESEARLNLLLRTNDRTTIIKEERDNYEDLIGQLQALKSEYDSWARTVQ